MKQRSLAPARPLGALAAAFAILLVAVPVQAGPKIEWLGSCYPLDLSADGRAVAGNLTGSYLAFRWAPDTGVVQIADQPVAGLGGPAGTPDISDDGLRVSASVMAPDSTAMTQGIWTKGLGWSYSMPPLPTDGGSLDNSYGSCWGLSGDGTTLTGFYWRPGQAATGLAHANTWNLDGTFTEMPQVIRNSRGNDTNYDGSVVVGWSERQDGVWCPTVWENGGYTVLHDQGQSTQAEGISNDGDTIWGSAVDTLTNIKSAAIWVRTESGWQENILGALPGTFPGNGAAICNDRSAEGGVIVGYNTFDGSPYNNTGFVWTLVEGMVSAADYFADRGVVLPPTFVIDTLTGISANGNVICGFGYDASVFPYTTEGFVITLDDAAPVPDAAVLSGVRLEPNFPNPFNPATNVALSLDADRDLQLGVYDIGGRLVRRLHDGRLVAGRHVFSWDGRDADGRSAASGVYLSRVTDGSGVVLSRRMTLVK